MGYGKNLKDILDSKGMTVKELARKTGIAPTTLSFSAVSPILLSTKILIFSLNSVEIFYNHNKSHNTLMKMKE